jgi:glycosyltransferase involved in cell wall biosynthesis
LAAIDRDNEYILYLDRAADERANRRPANFVTRVVPGATPVIGMPWREQVGLAVYARKDRLDLLHAPNLTAPLRSGCPTVVTLHDVIWLFPERFAQQQASWSVPRQLMQWYYRWIPLWAAQRAAAVITVSQASKDDIVRHLHIAPDRVFVTVEAQNDRFRPAPIDQVDALRERYRLNGEFIMALGSADPRKNIRTLLNAYSRLSSEVRARYRLVIIWAHESLTAALMRQVEELGLADRVTFIPRVPAADLVLFYNAAALFVFPTLYEGFGLPPLEAMACGTAVVASNNSSIPEVVGEAALLFDADHPESITGAITQALTAPGVRARMIEQGLARAASFSWLECARQTLAAYRFAASAGASVQAEVAGVGADRTP